MLSQRAQGTAYPAGVEQGRRGAGGLLLGTTQDCDASVMIDDSNGRKPVDHGAEVTQRVAAHAELDIVGVHEIQPETITNEDKGATIRRCDDESRHGALHRMRSCRRYPWNALAQAKQVAWPIAFRP